MINLTQDAKSVIFKDNAGVVLKSIEKGTYAIAKVENNPIVGVRLSSLKGYGTLFLEVGNVTFDGVAPSTIADLEQKCRSFFFSVGGSGGGGGNYKGGWNPKTNTPDIYTTAKEFDDFVVVEDLAEDEAFSFDFGAKGGIINLTNNDRVVFNGSNYVKQEYLVPDASEIPIDRNDASKGSVLEALSSSQTGLQAEITARQNADTALQNNITAEATARQNADTAINSAITAINNNALQIKAVTPNDLNNVTQIGAYLLQPLTNYTNKPASYTVSNGGFMIVTQGGANGVCQLLIENANNVLFLRTKNPVTSIWSAWVYLSSSEILGIHQDLQNIQQWQSDFEAVVAYRDTAVLKYIPNANYTYNTGNFIADTLTGQNALVMQNFNGGAKFIDLVNNGKIQLLPIGSRTPLPILESPDQNTNYNNEHGYSTGSKVEYQGDVWVYLEEDTNGVPAWVLDENTVSVSRSFELVDEYAEGTILNILKGAGSINARYNETIDLANAWNDNGVLYNANDYIASVGNRRIFKVLQNFTSNSSMTFESLILSGFLFEEQILFSENFMINLIIDNTKPLFNILDLSGNVVNSLPLRYLSSAENPIKNDGDLPLEVPRGTNGEVVTQADYNDYILGLFNGVISTGIATVHNQDISNYVSITNFALGNGTLKSSFSRTGLNADIKLSVTVGSTTQINNALTFNFAIPSVDLKTSINDTTNTSPKILLQGSAQARKFNSSEQDSGGAIYLTANNALQVASDKDNAVWSNSLPFNWAVGDSFDLFFNVKLDPAQVTEYNPNVGDTATLNDLAEAGDNIAFTLNPATGKYEITSTAQGGGTYADSQNYWVFKNVQDNPTAFIYNTLQKAHDAFVASGKSLGYIFMGAGQYTDPCTITATNLHIEGVGMGSRSQTQQNATINLSGSHRISLINILFGNNSATPPVVINCTGTLTENGVPNIGRGKPIFYNCSWSLANGVAPITITALNNWATFSSCDFGGKGALTLPNNATPVSWYYLFASCSNVGLIRGSNTITAIDSNSVSVIDISAQPTATAFRGNQLVTWVFGTPVFKGHFYYHNGVLYLAKNTIANSITAPNLDTTNFQNAIYSASPATTQYNVSDTLNAPPASPIDGETYLVGTSPTGAYAGKANNVAVYATATSTWSFIAPSTSIAVIFTGGANVGKVGTWSGTAWVVQTATSDSVPTGTLTFFAGNIQPGYVACSFRTTLSKVTHSALWNYAVSSGTTTTTNGNTGLFLDTSPGNASGNFQTPQLADWFIRPINTSWRVPGSLQNDQFRWHQHGYDEYYAQGGVGWAAIQTGGPATTGNGYAYRTTGGTGGGETNPYNVAYRVGIKL